MAKQFLPWQEIQVLLDDLSAQFSDVDDLIGLADTVVYDGPDGLEGLDIAIHALFGVIGLGGDGGREVSLQVERDDLRDIVKCCG